MKILIIGSGGREHAITWACAKSPIRPRITVTPGNGGTNSIAKNVEISAEDIPQLVDYVRSESFDLTIIGPEAPAIAGLADKLIERGFRVFGPTAAAARIEGSKVFSKRLMVANGIPTAEFEIFTDKKRADGYIRLMGAPIVVKASGIAAGKGALVCKTINEAFEATKSIFDDHAFGTAGNEVVIEACWKGREVSMTALCDGTDFLLLPSSRDHKRIFDHDRGPNTGGMGAYSPVEDLSPSAFRTLAEVVMPRLLQGLEKAGSPFRGVIYPGLMVDGDRFIVLEVNARFGDPETQVLLPLLKFDILEAMAEIAEGSFGSWKSRNGFDSYDYPAITNGKYTATVVAAAAGYPGGYAKGTTIKSLPKESDSLFTFHAGTRLGNSGFETCGGRVLAVTGLGETLEGALELAYDGIDQVKFEGKQYRKDIGKRTED